MGLFSHQPHNKGSLGYLISAAYATRRLTCWNLPKVGAFFSLSLLVLLLLMACRLACWLAGWLSWWLAGWLARSLAARLLSLSSARVCLRLFECHCGHQVAMPTEMRAPRFAPSESAQPADRLRASRQRLQIILLAPIGRRKRASRQVSLPVSRACFKLAWLARPSGSSRRAGQACGQQSRFAGQKDNAQPSQPAHPARLARPLCHASAQAFFINHNELGQL